jgi:long-chain acyl-CoA synthetase
MNIAQSVERAAVAFPDHPAVVFEGRTITYRELEQDTARLANALVGLGVGRGDRVGLYLPNIPAFLVGYLAIVRAGAVAVSINVMNKSEEVAYIVGDSGCRVMLTVADLAPNVTGVDTVVVCEGEAGEHRALDALLAAAAPSFTTADVDPSEPAALLYTSGTTGQPKGATLTHGNVVSNAWATAHHAGFRHQDRMLLFLPLFHVFGQDFIMNGTFAAAGTLVMHRRFVPDAILDSVRRDGVTVFMGVPTVYMALLGMGLERDALGAVRYEFSAAATMPQEISRRWTERFGRPVYEGYGLTETSPFATYNHDFRHRLGSIGTPVENTEARIVDEEWGAVPLGGWGEIAIRGPGVMKGYWNRPDDTTSVLRDGWLRSGDIGTMDDEGYLFIVDRAKDMINSAGFKVWPAEVEQVLYRHPAIAEAAVYGVADPARGEAVRASIVLRAGQRATPEELISYCQERIATYKVPATVELVDDLPKNATGKILKRVLRDASGSVPSRS